MSKHVIQELFSDIQVNDYDCAATYSNIDSLDLLNLKLCLEKFFSIELENGQMLKFKTINDALDFCQQNSDIEENKYERQALTEANTIKIGMPEMANSCLSENWLLKFIGNEHWKLIARGFAENNDIVLEGFGKERVYPSFVRLNYNVTPLNHFMENDEINFKTKIFSFDNRAFISETKGYTSDDNKHIDAKYISLFSARKDENSNELEICNNDISNHNIKELLETPAEFNEYRLARKYLLETITTPYGEFEISEEELYSSVYEINPYIDINGVGLLYFAAYPIISDLQLLRYNKNLFYWSTTYRDIFYFSNMNIDDRILFKLNYTKFVDDKIVIFTSLYRESDGKLISQILTVKAKNKK
jgi:probable biosynthetic protein (TIGR04098 family)